MELWCGILIWKLQECLINGLRIFRTFNKQKGFLAFIIGWFFLYLKYLFINLNHTVMSHEKAKEQANKKKEPTKSLKEKRLAKKAKKEEKRRQ